MKLRVWWLLILWSVATTAFAWIPTPVSIALSVGQWLNDEASKERVFEIRVEAQANTDELARREGFRQAVEQAVGTLVLSETEVVNGNINFRELINYASGFVYRYNIVSRESMPQGGVKLIMDVTVRRSAIADRLLNTSVGNAPIPGRDMSARLETMLDERQRGDQVVAQVVRDYPRRAFNIRPGPVEYNITADRQIRLTVPWELQFDFYFVQAVFQAMQATSQQLPTCWTYPQCPTQYKFVATVKSPDAIFMKDTWQASFSDPEKIRILASAMLGSQPAIQLTIRDNANQIAHTSCHRYQELDHQHHRAAGNAHIFYFTPASVMIDQHRQIKGTITMNIRQNAAAVANLDKVELQVVPGHKCVG
jgi:hypothetical protein